MFEEFAPETVPYSSDRPAFNQMPRLSGSAVGDFDPLQPTPLRLIPLTPRVSHLDRWERLWGPTGLHEDDTGPFSALQMNQPRLRAYDYYRHRAWINTRAGGDQAVQQAFSFSDYSLGHHYQAPHADLGLGQTPSLLYRGVAYVPEGRRGPSASFFSDFGAHGLAGVTLRRERRRQRKR